MLDLRHVRLARPTVVLLVGAVLALVVALVLRTPEPEATTATPAAEEEAFTELDAEVVAAAVDRIQEVEQPLSVWLRLADCESGEWDGTATPIPGSADWGDGTSPSDDHPFEGGLHFASETWDALRDDAMAEHAGDAAPLSQLVVAERVLDEQGWRAWPVCSRKLGLR